jgi:hypothetical protein
VRLFLRRELGKSMFSRLLVFILSFQIAVAPMAHAQIAGRLANDAEKLGEAAAGIAVQNKVSKLGLIKNAGKNAGKWAGRMVVEYGPRVVYTAAVGTLILALAFNQVFAGADVLADIQHTESGRNEDYLRRVWGYYLNDPDFVAKVPDTIEKATKLVNDSCIDKKYKCRVYPEQVKLSPVHDIIGSPGKVDGQQTCIFQVPADDFINENPVQAVSLHLAQLIAWCEQMPDVVNSFKARYNDDGTERHWYSVQDEIAFYKAASLFALDLLGLPNEMPHTYLDKNIEYFNQGGGFPQKYFNVGKSFAAYSQDFDERNRKGKIFDTSAAWLNSHGLQIRLQTIPYIYGDDALVISSCGRDGVEKLFWGEVAPCQTIIPGPTLEAKLSKLTWDNNGITQTLGNMDTVEGKIQRAKDWGADFAAGTITQVILFDIIGKKLSEGKKVEEVVVDLAKIGEEEALPVLVKSTLWSKLKNWCIIRWTGKSVKFLARSAVFGGLFGVGSSVIKWSVFDRNAEMEFPTEINDEVALLNSLSKDSAFYDTGDKPQNQEAKDTLQRLRAVLNSKDYKSIKIIADLAEKPNQAPQPPQKAQ